MTNNTPLNADDRLRHMIARQFVKRYRHGSLMTNGELNEEATTLSGSVYFDNIMRYIERDRKKHELEARIDELKRMWNATQPDIVPEGWQPETEEGKYLQKRIKELAS